MAEIGVLTNAERAKLRRTLIRTWRRVAAWLAFVQCSPTVRVSADPVTTAKNLIYALVDPRTQAVRYIGLSTTGMKRPTQHRRPASKQYYVSRWVEELRRCGLTFEIRVLEAGHPSFDDLCERERWWIAYGRACGWPLTNLTDGGEGTPGWQPTEQERERRRVHAREAIAAGTLPTFRSTDEHRERSRTVAIHQWSDPQYRVRQTAVLRVAAKLGAAGKIGDDSFMKRPDVRARHQESMRAVARRKRTIRLARVRRELAAIIFAI